MRTRTPVPFKNQLISAVVAGLLPVCASAGKDDNTLVVAFEKPLTTVDRLYSIQREGLILSRLTDDGLFYVNPDSLEFEPLAAESYEWINETTLEVTVRDDVFFHDGSKLTAEDVVYTFEWVLDENSDTSRGPVIQSWLESIEKAGPRTVRFNLRLPYPMALRDMAISIPVRKEVAMTGEVTLRGRVLAIGGLKEKLLAALRGGIKTVLIPQENEKDLADIPEVVKKGLEIVPVSTVDEVLERALSKPLTPIEWSEEDDAKAAALAAQSPDEAAPTGDLVKH